MMGRLAFFAAGAITGVWAVAKGRRAAYRLSAPGLVDQAASWRLGWREFRAELDDGIAARRAQQIESLTSSLGPARDRAQIERNPH